MKRVLFVGDGEHDIGKSDGIGDEPFPADGVVPRLAERVAAIARAGSVALYWAHPRLARFPASRGVKARGYEAKVRAAKLLVERGGLAVDGLVCVVDEDNDATRHGLAETVHALATPTCPIAFGVAVRSIEAWTFGAREALADVLGLTPAELRKRCPTHPEQFYDGSGKPGLRSKAVLHELARPRGGDSRDFREAVAERTDPAALAEACPTGFAPFAAALRHAFGPRPPDLAPPT